jgi:hypothetical protein
MSQSVPLVVMFEKRSSEGGTSVDSDRPGRTVYGGGSVSGVDCRGSASGVVDSS